MSTSIFRGNCQTCQHEIGIFQLRSNLAVIECPRCNTVQPDGAPMDLLYHSERAVLLLLDQTYKAYRALGTPKSDDDEREFRDLMIRAQSLILKRAALEAVMHWRVDSAP